MGIAYKIFQSIAYEGLEWGFKKGIKVDKDRQRERTNKLYKESRSIVDYDGLDRYWDNLLQESWDWTQDNIKKRKK